MPTVMRRDGLRFVIYSNDHPPPHVHVLGPGWRVIVDLTLLEVREVIGCNEPTARRVLRLVAEHRDMLHAAWGKLHG